MSHPYTGLGTAVVDPITLPDDGDAYDAASIGAALEDIQDGLVGLSDNYFNNSHFWIDAFQAPQNDLSRFSWDTSGTPGWLQSDVTSEGALQWYVRIPVGMKVVAAYAHIKGDGGSGAHAALPATLPNLELYRVYPDPGTAPLKEEDWADTSALLATYDAYHTVGGTCSEVFSGEMLEVIFRGEAGANAVNNCCKLYGINLELEKA